LIIGDRLRELRESKNMSQGDIEKQTGLLRCYISRVENGHTVPSIETLEKMARALGVPMYELFYYSEEPPSPKPLKGNTHLWGSARKDASLLARLRRSLGKIGDSDRKLLLHLARKLAKERAA